MEIDVYKKQHIDKEFLFPKSKERLGCKNKGFLNLFLSYNEHKPLIEIDNVEGRESVDKFITVSILITNTLL